MIAVRRSLQKIKAKPDDPNRPPEMIGYARVSMADQSPQLQMDALLAAGTFAELDRKGAKVRVLTQPGMDTTTVMGRLIVTIMAAVAEMEKDLIQERTRAGLLSAKERGRVGGRKKEHTDAQVRKVAHMTPAKAAAALRPPFKSISGYLKRLDAMRTNPDGT